MNENIEKVHRAAARASVQTGAPIMAHSRPASNTGPRQVEIFVEEGVDSKIQIAHTGDTDDLDYIEGLLETGVWVGLDRYGLDLPAIRQAPGDREGRCSSAATPTDLPLGGLGRDDRLVPGERDRAADRVGRGERLDDPDRPREGAPRAPRVGA